MQFKTEIERLVMSEVDVDRTVRDHLIEIAGLDLAFKAVGIADRTPTGEQILDAYGMTPRGQYVVLQWLNNGDIEEIRPTENLKPSPDGPARVIIAQADRTFRFTLDDHSMVWPEAEIREATLRKLGRVPHDKLLYLALEDAADRQIEPGTFLDLAKRGSEVIYSRVARWVLNVQGVSVESTQPEISVRDALVRAGFDVETDWIIVLKTASEKKQVNMDYVIDLREPGIEKLRLTPREINNGEVAASIRRDFALTPADHAWLDARGYDWSTVLDMGRRWLILRDVSLPAGYNVPAAVIAMEIPTAYPMAEIDMFYCSPHLARSNGQGIPQTEVTETIGGRPFQRWSRHRGAGAPWRAGKDCVATHLLLVEESLNREVEK